MFFLYIPKKQVFENRKKKKVTKHNLKFLLSMSIGPAYSSLDKDTTHLPSASGGGLKT